MAMRTSGKSSDLSIIAVPVLVLFAIGVWLAGDPQAFFRTTERKLWQIVETVGTWVSSLF